MADTNNTDTAPDLDDGLDWIREIAAWQASPECAAEAAAEESARESAKIAKAAKIIADRCPRCSGRGNLPGYEHISGGVCFRCGGSGVA